MLYVSVEIIDKLQSEREEGKHKAHLLAVSIQTLEKERRRISSDLHDELAGKLSWVKMKIADLSESGKPLDPSSAEKLAEGISESIGSIRGIIREFQPHTLEKFGLGPAIKDYVGDSEKPVSSIVEHGQAKRLSPKVEINIYRMIQEAVNNVRKHAKAKSFAIMLEWNPNELIVEIKDDGVGMDDFVAKSDSYGISNSKTRASLIGAGFEIIPTDGTTIRISYPYLKDE